MAIGDSGEGAASIHTIPTRTEDSSQTKNTMNTINQEGFPEWQPRQSTTSNMNKEQNQEYLGQIALEQQESFGTPAGTP